MIPSIITAEAAPDEPGRPAADADSKSLALLLRLNLSRQGFGSEFESFCQARFGHTEASLQTSLWISEPIQCAVLADSRT